MYTLHQALCTARWGNVHLHPRRKHGLSFRMIIHAHFTPAQVKLTRSDLHSWPAHYRAGKAYRKELLPGLIAAPMGYVGENYVHHAEDAAAKVI